MAVRIFGSSERSRTSWCSLGREPIGSDRGSSNQETRPMAGDFPPMIGGEEIQEQRHCEAFIGKKVFPHPRSILCERMFEAAVCFQDCRVPQVASLGHGTYWHKCHAKRPMWSHALLLRGNVLTESALQGMCILAASCTRVACKDRDVRSQASGRCRVLTCTCAV